MKKEIQSGSVEEEKRNTEKAKTNFIDIICKIFSRVIPKGNDLSVEDWERLEYSRQCCNARDVRTTKFFRGGI